MKGYCPGWASKALRPSFKNNTPMDALTPSWCLGPPLRIRSLHAGSCAKTAQAAASLWFGEGSAADYWQTTRGPSLLCTCSPHKEPSEFLKAAQVNQMCSKLGEPVFVWYPNWKTRTGQPGSSSNSLPSMN